MSSQFHRQRIPTCVNLVTLAAAALASRLFVLPLGYFGFDMEAFSEWMYALHTSNFDTFIRSTTTATETVIDKAITAVRLGGLHEGKLGGIQDDRDIDNDH